MRSLKEVHKRESAEALNELGRIDLEKLTPDPVSDWELPMSGIRTSGFDSITPERIDGVTEISTVELIKLLRDKNRPVLIDASCFHRTIPTAKCIFASGWASPYGAFTENVTSQFNKVLADIVPSKDLPVVAFCNGVRCWASANVAFRVAKAGYRAYWYRHGMNEWNNRKLPDAKMMPVGATAARNP